MPLLLTTLILPPTALDTTPAWTAATHREDDCRAKDTHTHRFLSFPHESESDGTINNDRTKLDFSSRQNNVVWLVWLDGLVSVPFALFVLSDSARKFAASLGFSNVSINSHHQLWYWFVLPPFVLTAWMRAQHVKAGLWLVLLYLSMMLVNTQFNTSWIYIIIFN